MSLRTPINATSIKIDNVIVTMHDGVLCLVPISLYVKSKVNIQNIKVKTYGSKLADNSILRALADGDIAYEDIAYVEL